VFKIKIIRFFFSSFRLYGMGNLQCFVALILSAMYVYIHGISMETCLLRCVYISLLYFPVCSNQFYYVTNFKFVKHVKILLVGLHS
jgi:hypothetical protein